MKKGLESCTQLQCMLRREGVDSHFLAELIVGALAGEDVRERLDAESSITAYERCIGCVERVMRDEGPLKTREQVERLLEAGEWSSRRQRRALRREGRSSP